MNYPISPRYSWTWFAVWKLLFHTVPDCLFSTSSRLRAEKHFCRLTSLLRTSACAIIYLYEQMLHVDFLTSWLNFAFSSGVMYLFNNATWRFTCLFTELCMWNYLSVGQALLVLVIHSWSTFFFLFLRHAGLVLFCKVHFTVNLWWQQGCLKFIPEVRPFFTLFCFPSPNVGDLFH